MKIEITPELLSDLKDKASAATPGPWEAACMPRMAGMPYCAEVISRATGESLAMGDADDDLAYIAAASPDVVLALIGRIERLEKEADWLAEYGQGIAMCPFLAFQYGDGKPVPGWCEGSETAEDGFECPKDEPVECWRNAASKAVEEQ